MRVKSKKLNLPHPLIFSTEAAVESFSNSIPCTRIGKHIRYFQETISTNDLALSAARSGGKHGHVFIAEQQLKGRGRSGRSWHAPACRGLLLSVILRPDNIAPSDLGWIPLFVGLAAAEALNQTCGIHAGIKWPNDIILSESSSKQQPENFPGWHKLGGILCESSLTPGFPEQNFVVVGIGLNLNQSSVDFPPQTKAPPTSVLLESGRIVDRKVVLSALLQQIEKRLHQLENIHKRTGLCRDIEAALRRWWTPAQLLVVNPKAGDDNAALVEGTFAGLDTFGRLGLNLGLKGEADKIQFLADAEILKIQSR
jgi:BirA family biotin operon repressor/biotin-[acetyl-CoA-carboxylase] ligase